MVRRPLEAPAEADIVAAYLSIEGMVNGYPRSDPRAWSPPSHGALTLLDIADTLDELLEGVAPTRLADEEFPLFAGYQRR